MNNLTAMLMSAIFMSAMGSTAAVAQADYEFNDTKYKLSKFPTEYEKPSDTGFLLFESNEKVDLTSYMSVVKDQGARGSCAYFAASGLIEHSIMSLESVTEDINMSEEYLIYYGKKVLGDSSTNDGSTVRNNLYAISQGGMLLEEDMPYTYSWFSKGMHVKDKTKTHLEM